MENLVYSASPHIKTPRTTKHIMIDVCIALLPATIVGIVFFGFEALLVMAISVISAVLAEFIYKLCFMKKGKTFGEKLKESCSEFDYTSLVTGMLIGMNMPSKVNWYIPVFASFFAIIIVKMLFGGTGKNIVNPAIAGRIFVFISFGIVAAGGFAEPIVNGNGDFMNTVTAGATPLGNLLMSGVSSVSNLDLFLGNVAGTIGETSAAALLAGGIYLVARKVIDFKWPLIYIVVTGVASVLTMAIIGKTSTVDFGLFLPSILSGGLMLGAIFMATDYTTTPNTTWGNVIYFVALGLITAILRCNNGTEVVSFAIMLMNLVVPLIDKYVVPKPFGYVKAVKTPEQKEEKKQAKQAKKEEKLRLKQEAKAEKQNAKKEGKK